MEKIKQKVEQVLGKDHHDTTTSGTAGHSTSTHGATTGTTTGTHHAGSDPTGPHDSRLANKADPRVDSDRIGTSGNTTSAAGGYGQHSGITGAGHTTGTGLTGTAHSSDPSGPHDSRLANKADPRVDSDRMGGHGNTAGAGGYGSHNTGLTGTGASHVPGGQHSDPTGPHDTRMANKLDPRVSDSDRTGGHTSGAGFGTGHGTHTSGLTGATHGSSDPTGPHESRVANKLDPRVDSDRIGSHGNTTGAGGYGTHSGTGLTGHSTTGSGLGGTHGTHGSDPTGPHQSHLANVADPRVDSDRVGGHGNTTGAGGYGTSGHNSGLTSNTHHTSGTHGAPHGSHLPGPADNTAGPHKSNILNKMDPTVDSDLDGSKKIGGDRTFG